MATRDSQDDVPHRSLEHELRDALRLGRHRVGIEHDLPGFAPGPGHAPARTCAEGDGDHDRLMSDAAFAAPGSLSDAELRDLIDRFAARERAVSYERRMLHGRMDLLRAELVVRLRRDHGPAERTP